jgi:hypothetical protein
MYSNTTKVKLSRDYKKYFTAEKQGSFNSFPTTKFVLSKSYRFEYRHTIPIQ